MTLVTYPNIGQPDAFYAELIDAQRSLDFDAAMALNARLVLILANHIGDREILSAALALACKG